MHGIGGWIGLALTAASTMASAQDRVEMPTAYEAGHFYATPVLENGHSMRLIADTAGAGGSGWFVLDRAAAQRLGIPVESCKALGETFAVAKPIAFQNGKSLPAHNDTPCDAPALVSNHLEPADREDGQLGAGYWPGHVWTFDYPAHKLWLEPAHWRPDTTMHRVHLGVNRDEAGHPVGGFARITMRVDGVDLPMLLDTGATAHPSAAGKISQRELTASGFGVTSYITRSQLDQWHARHPDWRVIANGDDLGGHGERLIEVPTVEVGGWRVASVWFTERPDVAFDDHPGGMASFTDGPVSGALGANVYRHFRMTIDYPDGVAFLACVTDCHAANSNGPTH